MGLKGLTGGWTCKSKFFSPVVSLLLNKDRCFIPDKDRCFRYEKNI